MPLTTSNLKAYVFFFFNDTATTEIYTLSLHDALPISPQLCADRTRPAAVDVRGQVDGGVRDPTGGVAASGDPELPRSEEHTSELQSLRHLVCRLLLEKKKRNTQESYSVTCHWSDVYVH